MAAAEIWKTFLNVAATPKVIMCCILTASRWCSVFRRVVSKVNTQQCRSTFQNAGRSTQGPPDAASPRCAHWSLVRQRNLARSSPASSVCGEKELVSCEGTLESTRKLEEPPFLLHHLADSLCRLDADSHRRRDISLTFPDGGWLDGVDWNHEACKWEPYFPFGLQFIFY